MSKSKKKPEPIPRPAKCPMCGRAVYDTEKKKALARGWVKQLATKELLKDLWIEWRRVHPVAP